MVESESFVDQRLGIVFPDQFQSTVDQFYLKTFAIQAGLGSSPDLSVIWV
jgi:hypothetical protein